MGGQIALPKADKLIREYDMFPAGAVVLCAVSGGADSMCLLHYLSTREDITLHAAHFDHRLRGEESRRDAAFVRAWCEEQGIPFHLGSGDVRGEARARKLGLEETARALRYGFLSQLAQELNAQSVATAHNAGDNAETVLMHLLRGSGLQGLTGIAPRQGRYVRPLLTTSRADIEGYLEACHVPHVEDSSNADDAYTRNRLRHQLIPLMEELSPGFVARMAQTIPRLRADHDALDLLAWQDFQKAWRQGDDVVMPLSPLCQAPAPIALRAIRFLLQEANEGDRDCSAAHLNAVYALACSRHPSGQVSLPRGLTARREYDTLILTHDAPAVPLAAFSPKEGENPVPGTGWTAVVEGPAWPGLVIRARQSGDALTLPGRPDKRLKELMIDEKLPRWERQRVPVAADGDGVLAVAGFGVNTAHPRGGRVRFTITQERENGT